MMNELTTIALLVLGFLLGVIFTLFLVCSAQALMQELASFPIRVFVSDI